MEGSASGGGTVTAIKYSGRGSDRHGRLRERGSDRYTHTNRLTDLRKLTTGTDRLERTHQRKLVKRTGTRRQETQVIDRGGQRQAWAHGERIAGDKAGIVRY